MPIIENGVKRKLDGGGLAIGFGVNHLRTVNTAGIAEQCGYDWLFVDMEHNSMDIDTAVQICVAALPTGVTPIVRVPSHDPFHASRALDGGAMGIVVPHVNTADQARRVVDACKFPPLGHRSLTAPAPQLGYAALPVAEAIATLNRTTLIVVMLETPEAIDNAEAIAAVEGVDVLLIGTNDLTAEMGIPGQYAHERVVGAYERMIAATRKYGKAAGMGGIYDNALMEKYIRLGVRMVLGGGDIGFMMAAAKARAGFLAALDIG